MVFTSVHRLQFIDRPCLLYIPLSQLCQPLSNNLVETFGIFKMNPMGPGDGLLTKIITISMQSKGSHTSVVQFGICFFVSVY